MPWFSWRKAHVSSNVQKTCWKYRWRAWSNSILQSKQDIIVNNLKVSRSTTTQLIFELYGDFNFQPDQQVLHPRIGSSTTIGCRIKVGILGDLQLGLHSDNFLSRSSRSSFRKHLHRRTCCWGDFDTHFILSGSCFSLAGKFQFLDNRPEV